MAAAIQSKQSILDLRSLFDLNNQSLDTAQIKKIVQICLGIFLCFYIILNFNYYVSRIKFFFTQKVEDHPLIRLSLKKDNPLRNISYGQFRASLPSFFSLDDEQIVHVLHRKNITIPHFLASMANVSRNKEEHSAVWDKIDKITERCLWKGRGSNIGIGCRLCSHKIIPYEVAITGPEFRPLFDVVTKDGRTWEYHYNTVHFQKDPDGQLWNQMQ